MQATLGVGGFRDVHSRNVGERIASGEREVGWGILFSKVPELRCC